MKNQFWLVADFYRAAAGLNPTAIISIQSVCNEK